MCSNFLFKGEKAIPDSPPLVACRDLVLDALYFPHVVARQQSRMKPPCDEANVTLGDVFLPTSLLAMICLILDSVS